jgi:hypothetical protein
VQYSLARGKTHKHEVTLYRRAAREAIIPVDTRTRPIVALQTFVSVLSVSSICELGSSTASTALTHKVVTESVALAESLEVALQALVSVLSASFFVALQALQ